jgi:hypothetical protein
LIGSFAASCKVGVAGVELVTFAQTAAPKGLGHNLTVQELPASCYSFTA